MPTESITDGLVRSLTGVKLQRALGGKKQVTFMDRMERGLALLLVAGEQTRTFRVLTYVNGKPKTTKLGRYPGMTVKQARERARQYWEDPSKFDAQAEVGSFKEIADNWLKRYVEANKLRSKDEIERHLTKYVYPRWKDTPFLDIKRRQVADLLDQIEDDNGPAQANAVLATIRGVMTWHQSRDENYTSPIVKGMRRKKSKARHRILDDSEIRAVWGACEDVGMFGAIVRLALLTAQRREKITSMKWADIKDGVWTIAGEDREKATAGQLKLPQMARDIIEDRPKIDENPYIFASGSKKHFNSWSQQKQELDEKLPKMEPWVIHDLRRTAKSLMARADVWPDISERVLGHAIPGVEGIYDRHSYAEQKADALEKLAALIDSIINPRQGNVITMSGRQKRSPR